MRAAETRALWRASQFAWGRTDCLMALSDHVLRLTGRDPAEPWRGAYDDEVGARAIYDAHGGVMNLVSYAMDRIGLPVGAPCDGAALICELGGQQIGGAMDGTRVIFMAEGRGVVRCRAPILRAWPL